MNIDDLSNWKAWLSRSFSVLVVAPVFGFVGWQFMKVHGILCSLFLQG